MKYFKHAHAQKGISLVEIMIALTLGLFLLAGIIKIFSGSKQSYNVTDASSRLQENGRFAMAHLTRRIRMAGYIGCFGDANNLVNNINSSASVYDFNTAIEGTNDTGINNSDSITVRMATGTPVAVTEAMANATVAIKSQVINPAPFAEGDIAVISDCSGSAAFQISSYTASDGTIEHDSGSGTPGNSSNDLQHAFGTDSEILKISTVQFFIATGSDGQPSLWRTVGTAAAEELVQGVENMQLLYGEDLSNDGIANRYVESSTAGIDLNNIVSVRLSLLLQTNEDFIASSPQTYLYNGSEVTASDRRIRRVFSSTIKLRNRGVV